MGVLVRDSSSQIKVFSIFGPGILGVRELI